jgi:hypothetical protein
MYKENLMKSLVLLTTALTLTASLAFAQTGIPGAHFIEQWDMNADGQVTLDEAKEKRAEVFVMFDQSEDGIMDAAEWEGIAAHLAQEEQGNGGGQGGMGNGPGKYIHDAMTAPFNDTNGDGTVTKEEFTAATEALFAAIDRNGDGMMTSADFGRN